MDHIWMIEDWEKNIDLDKENHRTGLRLRFDKDIDPEVRRACKEFAVSLRREYFFRYGWLCMLKIQPELLQWMETGYMELFDGGKVIMKHHRIFGLRREIIMTNATDGEKTVR